LLSYSKKSVVGGLMCELCLVEDFLHTANLGVQPANRELSPPLATDILLSPTNEITGFEHLPHPAVYQAVSAHCNTT